MIAVRALAWAIKKELGSFFSTDAHSDMDIVRYINSRVRYIVTAKNFNFNKYKYTLTTNSNDTEYVIPYQIETFFVLWSDGKELELSTFEEYYRSSDKAGKVCINEDKLVTTVKWTLEIFYRWYPATLTSLSWNVDIPEHFFDLIVACATYYWFLDVKAYQKAWEKKAVTDWMIRSIATRQSDKMPLKIKRLNKWYSNIW
jgi:hypothetical protein